MESDSDKILALDELDYLYPADLINQLILVSDKLKEKQKDYNPANITVSKGTINKLISDFNNMIESGNIFMRKFNDLEEYKANKLFMIDEFNLLIQNIRNSNNKLKIIKPSFSAQTGAGIGQSGGGLFTDLWFFKKYKDFDFNEKLSNLDEIQKQIKAVNDKLYTNDLKKALNKYKSDVKKYTDTIKAIKNSINHSKDSDENNYFNLLQKYIHIIQLLNNSSIYDEQKLIDPVYNNKIFISGSLQEKINKLDSGNSSSISSPKSRVEPASIITKLTQQKIENARTINDYKRQIETLKKAVEQYKVALKSKSSGIMPTLSSAVRFSRTNQLLGIPASLTLLNAQTKKSQSKDKSGKKSSQQDSEDSNIESLKEGELFSAEFISVILDHKKSDLINFLAEFNKNKSSKFMQRRPDSNYINKFSINFLKKLLGFNLAEKKAKLYDKLKIKDSETEIDILIDLIIEFILFDKSGFDYNKNPDISILYNLLDEKLAADTMHSINTGTIFTPPAATVSTAASGMVLQQVIDQDKLHDLYKTIGEVFKSHLNNTVFNASVLGDDAQIHDKFKQFIDVLISKVNPIITNDPYLKKTFNIANRINSKPYNGVFNLGDKPFSKNNITAILNTLNRQDVQAVKHFMNESMLKVNTINITNEDITTYFEISDGELHLQSFIPTVITRAINTRKASPASATGRS